MCEFIFTICAFSFIPQNISVAYLKIIFNTNGPYCMRTIIEEDFGHRNTLKNYQQNSICHR